MTSGELITTLIRTYLSQGGRDALDADVRRKCEINLQEKAAKAWNAAPYSYKRTSANVSLAADGLGTFNFPSNFLSIGNKGGVYISGQKFEILPRPINEIERLRQLEGGTSSRPTRYGISDQTSLGLKKGVVHKINSSALTLVISNYERKRPLIVDRPVAPTLTSVDTGVLGGATFQYLLTNITADGETEGGEIASITLGSATAGYQVSVAVQAALNPRVTSRKLYRTVADGSTFKLQSTISHALATTVTDNTADVDLGATAPDYSTAITGMELFPEGFHESVFFEGLRASLMGNQGDLRQRESDGEFMRAVRDMWVHSRDDRNRVVRMPAYGTSASRY